MFTWQWQSFSSIIVPGDYFYHYTWQVWSVINLLLLDYVNFLRSLYAAQLLLYGQYPFYIHQEKCEKIETLLTFGVWECDYKQHAHLVFYSWWCRSHWNLPVHLWTCGHTWLVWADIKAGWPFAFILCMEVVLLQDFLLSWCWSFCEQGLSHCIIHTWWKKAICVLCLNVLLLKMGFVNILDNRAAWMHLCA